MQLSSSNEIEETLFRIQSRGCSSPFLMIERWMEVLGFSPSTCWVKIKGLPLQARHKGVFRLIGDCVGKTVEVDVRTQKKEILKAG